MSTRQNSAGHPLHVTEEGIENFWRWFGDSKIVDDKNRPLRLFHGTKMDVRSFDTFPAFFSEDPAEASAYAIGTRNRRNGETPNLVPVYLSIKNPIFITRDKNYGAFKVLNSLNGDKKKAIRKYQSKGFDGAVYTDPIGQRQYMVFDEMQIKSATGNSGEFKADSASITDRTREVLRTREAIEKWLQEMEIENATINEDLTVDVAGDVVLVDMDLHSIPVQFGRVDEDFCIQSNNLISLEGCPRFVGRTFSCHMNKLISLAGGPEIVEGDFYCYRNRLRTLQGSPRSVGGGFWCPENLLVGIKGVPESIKDDFISDFYGADLHRVLVDLFCSGAGIEARNLAHPISVARAEAIAHDMRKLVSGDEESVAPRRKVGSRA